MKKLFLIGIVLSLAGCAPAGPFGGDVINLHVGNDIYQVQKMPGSDNSWAAMKQQYWGFVDPHSYAMNVKMIEKVSGCKVIRETIVNEGQVTRAAVECPKGKKP